MLVSTGSPSGAQFKTKTQLAVEGLQEAIFFGAIGQGQRVTLNDLAAALGMSITPVREALRMMEGTGLITHEAHRGMTVNRLTQEDAHEISLLRAPMESLATRLAVERMTDADLAQLTILADIVEDAVATEDDARLTRANADWHFLLYGSARTKHVIKYITNLWKPFYSIGFWTPEQRALTLRDHHAIMKAARARNADEAASLMFEHVRTAHLSIMTFLRSSDQGPAERE